MSKKNSVVKLSIAETSALHKFDAGDMVPLMRCVCNADDTAEKFLKIALKSADKQSHGMAEHYGRHRNLLLTLVICGINSVCRGYKSKLVEHGKTANLIPEGLSGRSLVSVAGVLRLSRTDANPEPIREEGIKSTYRRATQAISKHHKRKANQ